MSDIVDWLKDCVFDYDELDDERLALVAESEVTRRCKEAAAEIERLRGLLRELYAATDEFWIADELLRRIREALGDAPDQRD